ncbi:MAG: hypothetical protein JWN30_1982 [Bacilli bacterium]|nr:hypothetical protein [Bacilli bacterium]
MKLHFLVTHDVHSQLDSYLNAGVLIHQLRSEWEAAGDQVLVIDLGDHMDRVHPVTEGTLGLANAHLLGKVGYDLWTFGNNEGLTIPTKIWPRLAEAMGSKPLISNMSWLHRDAENQFEFDRQRIIDICGKRIGFLGITANFNEYYNLIGVHLQEPLETVRAGAAALLADGCDLVIVLSHCGLTMDRSLAQSLPGLDVIFGSHSHNVVQQGEWVNDTLICQGGKFARYIVHTALEIDLLAKGAPRQAATRCNLLEVPAEQDFPSGSSKFRSELFKVYQQWQALAAEALGQVMGRIETPYPHQVTSPSSLVQWVTHQMRAEEQVDVVILNQGLLNAGLTQLDVTAGDLHAACTAPINMVTVRIPGKGLRQLYAARANPDIVYRRGIGFGFRGEEIGLLVLDGIEELDGNVLVNGEALCDDKQYAALIADYLLFSRVFPGTEACVKVAIDTLFLRERMATWLNPTKL